MVNVPAICNKCGTIFPSGIVAENAFSTTFANCQSGTCPKCGSMGHIPDGTFDFVKDTIEILNAPSRTVEELHKLRNVLIKAKNGEITVREAKEIINSEVKIHKLTDLLPKNRSELFAFISIILMLIEMLLNQTKNSAVYINIDVDKVINQIYSENLKK